MWLSIRVQLKFVMLKRLKKRKPERRNQPPLPCDRTHWPCQNRPPVADSESCQRVDRSAVGHGSDGQLSRLIVYWVISTDALKYEPVNNAMSFIVESIWDVKLTAEKYDLASFILLSIVYWCQFTDIEWRRGRTNCWFGYRYHFTLWENKRYAMNETHIWSIVALCKFHFVYS